MVTIGEVTTMLNVSTILLSPSLFVCLVLWGRQKVSQPKTNASTWAFYSMIYLLKKFNAFEINAI
jgi:hypothetical protein